MASELITVALLAKHFKVTEKEIETSIAALKLEGMRFQGQTVYPAESTIKVLEPKLKPPDPLDDKLKGLREALESQLNRVLACVKEIELVSDKQDTLLAGLSKVSEQNGIIFHAIERIQVSQNTILDAIEKLSIPTPPDETAASPEKLLELVEAHGKTPKPPRHNPQPMSMDKKLKRRIGIVGLLPSQVELITKEFDPAFDIRCFLSDDAKGRDFREQLKHCERVFMMINFVNHGIQDAIIASGDRLVKVAGGMSSLRDKLTELFEKGVETA